MVSRRTGSGSRLTSPTILPDPTSLQLVHLEAEEQFILVVVATTSLEACCPLCQSRSERVHSRYVRLAADLPWAGWAVRLELHVRRFFCQKKDCLRRIFTERLPGIVAPYARRTMRLTDLFTLIGFALGGEAAGPTRSAWRGLAWPARPAATFEGSGVFAGGKRGGPVSPIDGARRRRLCQGANQALAGVAIRPHGKPKP